ncbi:ABC transporter permease [Burkholderia contaminans]|uniref:ABC transporter permease n=1 Tax=Burkholderia contaminans TaxID=488447 RepID=UPI001CA9908F|nr:ABC transporter permease [Burkholderia contaminans]UAC71470.1 ABC transporter permease [Burkholderia contaminans]
MLGIFKALWSYRGFILGSVKREFQSKYRNSLLGAAWTVLNPLSMIVVYTVIFSGVMHNRLPGVENRFAYSVYLCAGVLTWGLFTEIVGRGQNTFIENANLLKKLSFPRLCLPVIAVANALVDFGIVFGLFTVFLMFSGNFPGLAFVALIPTIALLVLFAVGLGITLGVLNVFFRDVGQFFGIVLSFWFWMTPIVYSVSILPERVQSWMRFNPMSRLIEAFQTILVRGAWPNWYSLWPVLVLALALCGLGFTLFRKHAGEMVDEL